ncbi:MAG: sugar phosphate isomerase/epimerase [Provencibacterium sp.]|jgi:3-dehydroshikimate dehydratase|nr:sugar phosphate isomerase/epimerase [Provencibacterium sp.]
MTGLVSVTFRELSPKAILALAKQAGLEALEWGGDIHVPAGEIETARQVGEETRAAGLAVLSYGSYYRLCAQDPPEKTFMPVLETAQALGAPNIRIWAGGKTPEEADAAYRQAAARELELVCGLAGKAGLTVSLEYHRGTLTQTAPSALALIEAAASPNLSLYWQPNPDISYAQNLEELRAVKGRLSHLHVFHWRNPENTRYPLAEGAQEWRGYIEEAGKDHGYLMEFVRDSKTEQFLEDARVLQGWLN